MIDEKGKLFGKINIIDLLVLLLVLVIAVVLGMKLLGKNVGLPQPGSGTEIVYTVKVTRMDPDVYQSVKEHFEQGETQLMASGEMVAGANITAISATPGITVLNTADGRLVEAEDPYYVDAIFSIRGPVINPITHSLGNQEIRVGRSVTVKTLNYEMAGLVLTCDPVKPA